MTIHLNIKINLINTEKSNETKKLILLKRALTIYIYIYIYIYIPVFQLFTKVSYNSQEHTKIKEAINDLLLVRRYLKKLNKELLINIYVRSNRK